jgi:hypothetical protein
VVAVAVLTGSLLEFVPVRWDDATAAGIGYFVLIPLVMLASACGFVGVVLSVFLRRDWRLPVLAVGTVALPVLFVIADDAGVADLGTMGPITVA